MTLFPQWWNNGVFCQAGVRSNRKHENIIQQQQKKSRASNQKKAVKKKIKESSGIFVGIYNKEGD